MSLLNQIEIQKRRVSEAAAKLSIEHLALRELEARRTECTHNFSEPVLYYEHEGGYCTKCGINELYAYTLKK